MLNIAIFASGTGSNAKKIIEHFKTNSDIQVKLVVSNKKTAAVLDMAASFGIDTKVITRKEFYNTTDLLTTLSEYSIDFIALAGFLWLIPTYLVEAYPRKMVNIHPALLPKFGGKGMYGSHVHEAVAAAQEPISGMTIHFVNEQYDEGNIIFQAHCYLTPNDTPKDIARKVLVLEHQYFSQVIEQLLLTKEW